MASRRRRPPAVSRMSLRVAEVTVKVNGVTTLHARSLELQAEIAHAAGVPLVEHVQLALPSSATNVPTCGECGRFNYHLESCSRGVRR